MTKLYMLVGIPCSGKTTFREEFFSRTEWVHISSDDTIEKNATMLDMTYNEIFPHIIQYAEKINELKAKRAVEKSFPIIWDQTNLTIKSRAKKLALFPETYRKIAYVFPNPSENTLQERLISRPGKNIPNDTMQRMISTFEYPTIAEGFDEIRNRPFVI